MRAVLVTFDLSFSMVGTVGVFRSLSVCAVGFRPITSSITSADSKDSAPTLGKATVGVSLAAEPADLVPALLLLLLLLLTLELRKGALLTGPPLLACC